MQDPVHSQHECQLHWWLQACEPTGLTGLPSGHTARQDHQACCAGTQHSIFELLVEASSSRFMAEPGKQLVAKLVQHLGGLDCGGLQEAVQKLQAAAALVPQGPEAMQDTLQALQVQRSMEAG